MNCYNQYICWSVCTQAGLQVTGFYDQTQIFFFLNHVVECLNMFVTTFRWKTPWIWQLLTLKMGGKIQKKLLFVWQIRENSFFLAATYWKKIGYKVMNVRGCNTKRENTLNFPKTYNAKFLYLGRFKCNKHSFSNLSDYILKRQWNYFISAESDFYQLLCVLVFDFQNRNDNLIVMSLAEICWEQFLSSWV